MDLYFTRIKIMNCLIETQIFLLNTIKYKIIGILEACYQINYECSQVKYNHAKYLYVHMRCISLSTMDCPTHVSFRDKIFTVHHPPNLADSLNSLAASHVTKTKGVDYFLGPYR